MAAGKNKLTPAAFAQIFVALRIALEGAGLRPEASLGRPENLWALAVLLGERAYWAAQQNERDYRIAVQALGALATGQGGKFWTLLVEAGGADTPERLERSANDLASEIRRIGVDLLTAVATDGKLQAFRLAAAQIAPLPDPLPTLTGLFPGSLARSDKGSPTPSNPVALACEPRSSAAGKALVYAIPTVGGLVLLLGAYRHWRARRGSADAR